MISPARVEAGADLRELVGAERADPFFRAHWHERDGGIEAVRLEVARLRADGAVPRYPRWASRSLSEIEKAAITLAECGLDAVAAIDGVSGRFVLLFNGCLLATPVAATSEDVVLAVLRVSLTVSA